MKRLVLFVLAGLLLLVALPVLAADLSIPEQSPFAAFFDNTLQPVILSLLGTLVTVIVAQLGAVVKKRWGLELSAEIEEKLQRVAYDAVHAAEEAGASWLKQKGEKMVSGAKYGEAINYMLARAPSLTSEEADRYVTAALGKTKGLGASAELGY